MGKVTEQKRLDLKKLQRINLFLFVFLLVLIIGSIFLVTKGINLSERLLIEEEYVESIIIIVLLLVSYSVTRYYQQELKKKEILINEIQKTTSDYKYQLEEAFKYIGQVNVQLNLINESFKELKLPQEKGEMKNMLGFLTEKIMIILGVDWTVLRLINTEKIKTIRESIKTRGSAVLLKYEISNQNLLEGNTGSDYSFITTSNSNFTLKAFAIFPSSKVTSEQKVLVEALIRQIEMAYLVYSSQYFKN